MIHDTKKKKKNQKSIHILTTMTVGVVGHLPLFSSIFLSFFFFSFFDDFFCYEMDLVASQFFFFSLVIDLTMAHRDAWKTQSKFCFDTKFDA